MDGDDIWEGLDDDALVAALDACCPPEPEQEYDVDIGADDTPMNFMAGRGLNHANPVLNRNKSVLVDVTPVAHVKARPDDIRTDAGSTSRRQIAGPAGQRRTLLDHRFRRSIVGEPEVGTQVMEQLVKAQTEGVNDIQFQTEPWLVGQQFFSEGRVALGSILEQMKRGTHGARYGRLLVLVEEQRAGGDGDLILTVKVRTHVEYAY